ncbi:MAG TPA: MotA/TolQ/ExbB proton channel family protein [Sporichthya sp.]|nr:MotA/TolQ/ExbB proton channel family protein [Sporichthya sp.]
MDPATFAGLALAFGAIFLAAILEGSSPMAIFLIPPMILVFFGTFGAGLAGSTMKDFLGTLKSLSKYLTAKVTPPDDTVAVLVDLAGTARKEGLLALGDKVRHVEDPFLKRGLEAAIDGTDPDELAEILEAEIRAYRKDARVASKLFTDFGGYAPTVGIIGTVLSLVHVLGQLSEPDKLGEAIASAFLATLWGVLSANIMWLPIAKRIERIADLECAKKELAVEGILAIQSGSNPRLVAQKLKALLPPGAVADKAA